VPAQGFAVALPADGFETILRFHPAFARYSPPSNQPPIEKRIAG
jgi:hypothetical protein